MTIFDKNINLESMIRINHAGESGAIEIYRGQRKYINKKYKNLIHDLLEHESHHLKFFEEQMIKRQIRPTPFLSLFNKLGYLVGAGSAKLGVKYAMMVTSAVESVIEEHYKKQLEELEHHVNEELARKIKEFCEDEVEHKNLADKYLKNITPLDKIFYKSIQMTSKLAIFLAKK